MPEANERGVRILGQRPESEAHIHPLRVRNSRVKRVQGGHLEKEQPGREEGEEGRENELVEHSLGPKTGDVANFGPVSDAPFGLERALGAEAAVQFRFPPVRFRSSAQQDLLIHSGNRP